MLFSPSENEFAEYYSQSGVAIACLVIGRTEQLIFVKFRTCDWEGYNGLSNYATTAPSLSICGQQTSSRRVL
jgi:hypothetical protein